MFTHQAMSPLKYVKEHIKIIRFGMKANKQDPWKRITGIFKFGKKIDPQQFLNEKGFEHA